MPPVNAVARRVHRAAAPVTALLVGLSALPAAAQNLLGFYLGGAFGASQINASSEGLTQTSVDLFGTNHTASELMAGIRPLPRPWVGAELEYVNLGRTDGALAGAPATAVIRGGSAFGLLYLPTPEFDLFAKAGIARMQTRIDRRFPVSCGAPVQCVPLGVDSLDETRTAFAAGAGAQARFGPLGVRLQYEYFAIPSEGSGMLSLGLNWTF